MLRLRSLILFMLVSILLSACGVGVNLNPSASSNVANDGQGLTEADIEATVQARLAAVASAQTTGPSAASAAVATPTSAPESSAAVEATATTGSATETLPTSAATGATETLPTARPASDPCPSPGTSTASGSESAPVAATETATPPPAMLLILDSSGSMGVAGPSGRPKIDEAKDALNQLVDALPDGAPVGLMVYGHRVPNTDKANGCQDVELIAPVGPLNKADMKTKIGSFNAVGYTPISTSLEQAAAALPPEGERTIILVSDGEETCDRDPCQVARDLEAKGIDVTIETVGFQVDAATRQQLECIAEATGGSYRDASNAIELADTLKQLSTRALKTYQTVGNAVSGGDSFNNAPDLAPGQYKDTIKNNETLYYAVNLQEGQRLRFSGTIVGQTDLGVVDEAGASVNVTLFSPTRQELGTASEYPYGRETKTAVLET